jgi:hypothetical protein
LQIDALRECSISSTVESLYDILNEELFSQEWGKYLIGVVTDGAAVMKGCNNSVLTKIKENYNHVWYLHCICHCLHLTSSKACEEIPEHIEQFV